MDPNSQTQKASTNPDFPTQLPDNMPPPSTRRGPVIFIISVVFFGLILTGAAATYWFVLRDKVKPAACTMEAKICPDGSSVGRTGPKCEFAPCPISIEEQKKLPIATPAAILQIPEIGIQITLPPELADLRYHVEQYETSTAILFTTDSLVAKFPKCEFPKWGLGWITRVSEPTPIHNKKIGDYYYGIEIMKENCSRKSGSEEGDLLESGQKESFLKIFDTIEPF